MRVEFELPFPIKLSVNNLYRYTNSYVYKTKTAKDYQTLVYLKLLKEKKFTVEKLIFVMEVYPPDKRKRDLDNLLKNVLDSLMYARMFHDDCQIVELHVIKKEVVKDGLLKISLKVKDNDDGNTESKT